MDRRERFLDAIGEVGSDLIFDAETKRFAPGPLRRWGGLAAALVLAAGLTVLALPWLQTDSTPQEAASSDTVTEAPPPSEQDIVSETETVDTSSRKPTAQTPSRTSPPTRPRMKTSWYPPARSNIPAGRSICPAMTTPRSCGRAAGPSSC